MFTNPHIRSLASLLPAAPEGGRAQRRVMNARPLWYRSRATAFRVRFFGCLLLIGAILLWPTAGVYAQSEGEVPDETIVQQAEIEEVEAEPETEEESEPIPLETDKPPSRFIPSEEISEDWSVTFPVDI
jgi:hypothetical protein